MTTTLEEVAHRMFIRNVADYAEPALAELAWIDPDIRGFWVQQAQGVMSDLTQFNDRTDSVDINDGGDARTSSRSVAVTSSRTVARSPDQRGQRRSVDSHLRTRARRNCGAAHSE
jgi:hypothetical protein